ncbi:MAG: flotillin family protein [Deltaproteobacteria bacterium]|nr:flotillin family protein [Deltaproteobacteria bacterium]
MGYVYLIVAIASFVLLFIVLVFLAGRIYVRCPANKILAVQGSVGAGRSVRCYHGGATFVVPLFQHSQFLDLTPLTIMIPLKGALSQQNIRVNVPSTFTIAIDTNPENMTNAAVRLLDLDQQDIESMAMEIIFGQLRLTIASLTIEEINQDRERFLEAIRNNIGPELQKIGLTLINVNITDITDESGYIESIGKKAAAVAINQAKIDVAEEEKRGDIGASNADRERRIKVAAFNAEAVEGENKANAAIASYDADLAEKQAAAHQRGTVAQQQAEAEIQLARAKAEEKRLIAEQVVPREIEKRKVEIDAEAEAERLRREAGGEAAAIIAVKTAEAEGIGKILQAKANGYAQMVDACNDGPKDAATMLMVEKIEEVVKLQVEAIKNIKIDKVTVWDSSGGENGTSSTSKFMSNLIKALPPLHEVANMAGVELPAYLGDLSQNAIEAEKS